MTTMNHTELGMHGEQLAVNFLSNLDYTILDRNFRFKKNEIDIVALKNDMIIVCEVKTRVTAEIGEPYKAVTRRKQKQIIATANYYIQSKNIDREVQFDIISIVCNSYRTKIEHIEAAFTPLL